MLVYLSSSTMLVAAALVTVRQDSSTTMLFMDKEHDTSNAYGLMYSVPPSLIRLPKTLKIDGVQTLLAAFNPNPLRPFDGYEIFFANDTSNDPNASSFVYFATTNNDFTGMLHWFIPKNNNKNKGPLPPLSLFVAV